MFIGRYVPGETVWIFATTHKFETGQEYPASITGFYLKVGSLPATKVSLTFNIFDSETGIYFAVVDTTGFANGTWCAIIEATIDTVIANQVAYFEVNSAYTRYAP